MHKSFYASGFLYHPASEQILLHQQNPTDKSSLWALIGSVGQGKETPEQSFKRLVRTFLKLSLAPAAIHPIYEYFHSGLRKTNCVCYGEVKKIQDFRPNGKAAFSWFTMKEISKLPLSAQTKQDIIVGQRVIASAVRKKAGERTIG